MKTLTRIVWFVLLILMAGGWFHIAHDSNATETIPAELKINIPDLPYPEIILFRGLVEEICGRLDIDVQMLSLPWARSIDEMNEGKLDAEGPRNPTVEKNYPDIVRVPEVFFTNDLVAFSRDSNIRLSGWDSLRPYRVAYVRGWKIYENNVKEVKKLDILDSEKALFKFLDAGRTDVALAARILGFKIIHDLNLKGIVVVEPPLIVKKMYLYMNKKHTKLAQVMAETLQGMKRDGTYQRIYNKTLNSMSQ